MDHIKVIRKYFNNPLGKNTTMPPSQKINSVLIHGTKVLGKLKERVTKGEIESISCDISTEAHILRHFTRLPDPYLRKIKGKEFSRYDIRKNKHVSAILDEKTVSDLLKTKGSKFFPNLASFSTPREIFEQAIEFSYTALSNDVWWLDKGDRDVAYFLFQAPIPIGTQNVIKLDEVASEVRATRFIGPRGAGRDAININIVKMEPPETNVMVIMLQRIEQECKLETAYPGIIVTDLPQRRKQTDAEIVFCERAWEKMAFVIQ